MNNINIIKIEIFILFIVLTISVIISNHMSNQMSNHMSNHMSNQMSNQTSQFYYVESGVLIEKAVYEYQCYYEMVSYMMAIIITIVIQLLPR